MMCPPSSNTFKVRIIAPAASRANETAKTSDFLTEADHERTRPRKTMKKKGPHRSQSLNAFPGSSLYGLGKTTSFKLLTILDKSLLTVSQTGSVRVFGSDPNPEPAILPPPLVDPRGGGAGAAGATEGVGLGADGGGRLEGMKDGGGGGAEDIGMEARGGDGGRAGRTDEGLEWIRFSISSMSDWELGWSGTVSLYDIVRGFSGGFACFAAESRRQIRR